jgi:hypothetical protein
MADRFEHHAERVEPERREVRRRVLRKRLRRMQHFAVETLHELMHIVDRRSGSYHESQVLQPGAMRRIRPADFGRRIEEEKCSRSSSCRAERKLVSRRQEWFKTDQRHQSVVVAFRRREIGNVDSDVSEHGSSWTARDTNAKPILTGATGGLGLQDRLEEGADW